MSNDELSNRRPGRPRIYQSPEQLQEDVNRYFATEPERPTIYGLLLALDFADRRSLVDYINRHDEYSIVLQKAISRIAQKHESRMYETTPAGSIFWLKNFGWSDTQKVEIDAGGELKDLLEEIKAARQAQLQGQSMGALPPTVSERPAIEGAETRQLSLPDTK